MVIFHSYVNVYQREYNPSRPGSKGYTPTVALVRWKLLYATKIWNTPRTRVAKRDRNHYYMYSIYIYIRIYIYLLYIYTHHISILRYSHE